MDTAQQQRARSDSESQRLVNLALAQNRVLEMIAAGLPLAQTLDALLRFLEKDQPEMLCSIVLLDPDGVHLRHCAAPSLPSVYAKSIDGAVIGPSAGSCGTAAYRREQVIVVDIETDPLWAEYRQLVAPHGLRACWSTPIFDAQGCVLGTFAMYFRKPTSPEPVHQRLIEVALHVAAIAMSREQRERAAHDSAERYRLLNLATNDAVWDWDVRTNLLWWNDGISLLFGYSKEEVAADISWWVERVHPEDRTRAHDSLQAAVDTGGNSWSEEYRFLRKDGSYAEVQDRGYVMRDAGGTTVRMIGMMQDITPRKRADTKIRRLNRTYAVLSGINAAIVRIRERQQLFKEVCRIAVELGQFGIAWIGQVDSGSEGCQLLPLVWSGKGVSEQTLNKLSELVSAATSGEASLAQRALRDRRPVHCNDLAPLSGPGWAEMLELTALNALIVLPLVVAQEAIGALVLHTTERDFFDEEELKLLGEMSENISFALEYLEQEQRIKDLAYHEPLTHLPNRAALQTHAAQAIDAASKSQHQLALLLVNLNYFRDINDSLGHPNGDLLLKQVARRLRASLGTFGHVASLGGDEFAILLPRLSDESTVEAALKIIREALQEPILLADIPINVEVTLGVALYPDHGLTVEVLWQHADVALRTAKERHEPCLVYSPSIDHYDPLRLALVGELRTGIEQGQLLLHYQPKIDLRSGRTIGVEALVRWQHPTRGVIYPDTFIPLAERTGLINPLTTSVVMSGLQQGLRFLQAGLALDLSVNLSARNLHDRSFCDHLLSLVHTVGFPLSRLTLEITETAIMEDPVRAKSVLTELHNAGIHLSMDDFGIGQSSLTYLKDLPISKMKIDKSFVMDFDQPRNAAIVRSAIDLARNMGLQVTAEGVEKEETYLALRDLGCDLAQGYYFSKPQAAAQLTSWLAESRWAAASIEPHVTAGPRDSFVPRAAQR